ncbi:MAG: glycerol-3-phosphate dehydrogenase/oxidase, partial [Bryobacteraceae bacterium]
MSRIVNGKVDVLVVGGGITGAGVARDAAMRGLSTLLVEQSDFASGTSSRSSRLLHGGLRYLAQGHIGLVREASHEKMRLSRIAPHLSDPLRFYFPVWKGDAWPRWMLAIGVHVYDSLCGGRNLGQSKSHSPASMREEVPGLRQAGLTGGVSYFDALTNDARLVIDTLRSAANAGATVYNYAKFVSATRSGVEWDCEVRDEESGEAAGIHAASVVNAAGAWAQTIPHSSVRLRLTKGVHLVINRSLLPVDGAVVLSEGQRILFVIPWGERVILGTTDTDYEGDLANVRTAPADIDYILRVINKGFPGATIRYDHLISTWAGVRPLIAPRRTASGSPSDLSRHHEIRMPEPGWFDVAGGKLTTYRLMAEQVVDRIGRYLTRTLAPSRTSQVPLTEGVAGVQYSGILPPPVEAAVVRHCCRNEWARRLDDFLVRRTSWHYYYPSQSGIAEEASRWMAAELGWNEEQRLAEL